MNYRHAYHAGNFADVAKHAVLALIIEALKRKDAPFAVLDVHAGVGCYDLGGDAAGRTMEYREGIERFLAEPPPPAVSAYVAAVHALNPGPDLRFYPGSPRVARHLMRPQDRLVLVELHPDDIGMLRREFAGDTQVAIHHRDAYEALKGLLPPSEKRGLVLIDPPFEAKDEFARIIKAVRQALRRWPTGIYCIWYPIKDRPPVEAFHDEMRALGVPPCLIAELLVLPDDYPARLNGCGLAIINPPWQLDATLQEVMPELHRRLGRRGGGASVRWLASAE